MSIKQNCRRAAVMLMAMAFAVLCAACESGLESIKHEENQLVSKTEDQNLEQIFAQEEERKEKEEKETASSNEREKIQGDPSSEPAFWQEVRGVFYGENYSESQFPVLEVSYLPGERLVFALYAEPDEENPMVYGVADIAGNTAQYIPDAGETVRIFLGENGVSLHADGELPFPVNGIYRREAELEITQALLKAMLTLVEEEDGGPVPGEPIALEEKLVDGWFYKALSGDRGFYIARDMSSIYGLTQEGPQLLWGSAESMLADWLDEEDDLPERFVSVLPVEAFIPVDTSTQTQVLIAGGLDYQISYSSDQEEVARVSDDGVITGVSPGMAHISGTVTVDGSQKDFSFVIMVEEASAEEEEE